MTADGAEHLRIALGTSGLLDHVEAAVLATTLEGVILYANPYCEFLYGRPVDTLPGEQSADYAEAVPEEVQAEIGDAILAGKRWEGEFRVCRADGEVITVHVVDSPLFDDDGKVVGVVSLAVDVSEATEREERMRLQIGITQFLADAGEILSSTLDYPETFQRLAQVCVPFLADLCLIDVLDGSGIRRMASVHADPARQVLADQLERRYPPDPFGDHPALRVIESGKAELQAEMSDDFLRATTRDDEHYRIVKALEFTSYMTVPLVARGRCLGAMSLVSAGSGRRFGDGDLALAEDLARRAALALDNARLYSERTRVVARAAVEPAAAVAPGGPRPRAGGSLSARRRRARGRWRLLRRVRARAGAVGVPRRRREREGPRGRRDRRAGAPHPARCITAERAPSRLLQALHETLLREESAEERFCTVCLGLVELSARSSARRQRQAISLTVSCGGHPPPIVVRDGRAEPTECKGTLLGITHDVSLVDSAVALEPGDAVVLYTDGVTEAHAPSGELFGEQRLVDLLAAHGDGSAGDLADAVLAAVAEHSQGAPRDDIALLVVRVPD